ncbi:MAG: hypothetical protein AB1489_12510 [Acidobacteriota bacterium]
MAVAQDISRMHLHEELKLMRDIAKFYKWGVIPNFAELIVLVTMYSYTGDLFIVELRCDNYKEQPPLFEFIDPDSGERATKNAYPRTNDSLFHESGPCICAPFNRKAYKSIFNTGPHPDWNLGDWMTSKANGCNWSNFSKLGDMLGLIQKRISTPELYKGRMA